jgi:type I restriction enzyme M protein
LTGSYRLTRLSQDYWSVLFGLGLKHEISFLDPIAASKLITKPIDEQAAYSPEAVERVLQLTAGHPYFVQMVCHNIVNRLNERQTTYVTLGIVEDSAQETLISADGHFRFMFESSGSAANQAVLVYIASSISLPTSNEALALPLYDIETFVETYRIPLERYELEDNLNEMARRDLITIYGSLDKRSYGFKIDLVRQWIRRNYDLQSAIRLAQSARYVRED